MATLPTSSPDSGARMPSDADEKRVNRHRVRTLIRAFNRIILNPLMLRFAGRQGFYAAVVRHVGRRSGRSFATPVVMVSTSDGFVMPLPYGAETDWCRNILAAGSCSVQYQGTIYQVDSPRIITAAEGLPAFPARQQRSFRLFKIRQFLQVRRVDASSLPA